MNGLTTNETADEIPGHAEVIDPKVESLDTVRDVRIKEMLALALSNRDACNAVCAVAGTHMLVMAEQLNESLQQCLRQVTDPTTRLEVISSVSMKYLKLIRLATHLTSEVALPRLPR